MSWAADRAEIATALNTVTGVKGYEYRPKTLRAGDAWPVLESLSLEHSLVWRPSWTVMVILPADERAAGAWIDDHFTDLAAALRVPGFPETADTVVIPSTSGDIPALAISMRSE